MASAPSAPAQEGLAFRGKHWRLWVGLDGVLRFVIEGDHDLKSALGVLEAFEEIGAKVHERPIRLLFYAHRALRLSPDARDHFGEALGGHRQLKVALVRTSPLIKIQAQAIARRASLEFTYHDSEPEALRALGAAVTVEAAVRTMSAGPVQPDVGLVDYVS